MPIDSYNQVPSELKLLRQWVCYDPRKRPLDPNQPGPKLPTAKTNDPSTWSYFDEAEAHVIAGYAAGVGFVFTDDRDDYVAIDLDACVSPGGELNEWSRRVVNLLGSYTEYSPSGTGIHIIVKGVVGQAFRRCEWHEGRKGTRGFKAIEIDCFRRYLTFTGRTVPFRENGIKNRGALLLPLLTENSDKKPLIARVADGLPSGGKNTTLMSMAGLLRGAGYDGEAIRLVLHRINDTCNDPPAPVEEIDYLCKQAEKLPPGEKRGPGRPKNPDFVMPPGFEDVQFIDVSDKGGRPKPSAENTLVLLPKFPEFAEVYYDEFEEAEYISPGIKLQDSHARDLSIKLGTLLGVSWNKHATLDALEFYIAGRPRNPLKEWLNKLSWDGLPRLDTWLARYVHRPDDRVAAVTGRKFLLAAINRAFNPGCYMPHILLLTGPTGSGKSYLGQILGEDWYGELKGDIATRDASMSIRNTWLVELPEMSYINRTEANAAKAFISSKMDKHRDPYARKDKERPRRFVLIGTSEYDDPLRDPTGTRRFWPVEVPELCAIEDLKAERDQLWAEAVHRHQAGEDWQRPDQEWDAAMKQAQSTVVQVDELIAAVAEYLAHRKPVKFTVRDLLADLEILALVGGRADHSAQIRVGRAATKLMKEKAIPYAKKVAREEGVLKNTYFRHREAGPGNPSIDEVL